MQYERPAIESKSDVRGVMHFGGLGASKRRNKGKKGKKPKGGYR